MRTLEARTRIEVKNILFATDLSPAAAGALPYAAELAKRFGAKLYALHVMTPIVNPMTEPATWLSSRKQRRQKRRRREKPCSNHFRESSPKS